ncbi:protein FAM214A [Cimex lectularius]|uniref:Atos-like conserved domain-containing protein n=1 Tax=Cimex lectularius TaxID=79782 RepID=A0A8I6R8L7_CIMLE|nr:protein FAM214A [Cimex lectularius]XP_014240537.1 protein FAM214A [Cimex lectularius]XP_014240538.1 protein FAM214A [Cimex lectularius]
MGSGGHLFVDVGMMLIEGRIGETGTNLGFREGPHCPQFSNSPCLHKCQDSSFLCERACKLRKHMALLSENCAPMCIDVLLCPDCLCGQNRANSTNICQVASPTDLLIEQWTVSIINSRNSGGVNVPSGAVTERVLLQALRSQLHFSQLSAWYSLGKIKHVCYRLSHPVGCSGFTRTPVEHHFPIANLTPDTYLKVSLKSLPRMDMMPIVHCPQHSGPSTLSATVTVFKSVFAELGQCLLDPPTRIPAVRNGFMLWRDSNKDSSPARRRRISPPKLNKPSSQVYIGVVDDRMQSGCKYIGKHHCEDEVEISSCSKSISSNQINTQQSCYFPNYQITGPKEKDVSSVGRNNCDISDGQLLDERGQMQHLLQMEKNKDIKMNVGSSRAEVLITSMLKHSKVPTAVNPLKRKWVTGFGTSQEASSKKLLSEITISNSKKLNQEKEHNDLAETFNRLDISNNAINEKPKERFSSKRKVYGEDSVRQLNNVKTLAIPSPSNRNYRLCWTTDSSSEETEGESPVGMTKAKNHLLSQRNLAFSVNQKDKKSKLLRPLLGNYEENLLSGRLQPSSVINGFTADLGASGTFCPQHLRLPVTVSFFAIEPHSTPYLGEIFLNKKGYTIPPTGTIQLTLLNPLGTVIKMFVVAYDVTDMPCNSHTFIRQRTVSDPQRPSHYLIHLRLRRSKSGRVSLGSDIKLIVSRQYDIDSSIRLDLDTAENSSALKVITVMPLNPKYTVIK